jgi:hypothetical protein
VTSRERAVLDEALRLTTRQRARLVSELLASLEGEPEQGAEAAWRTEVARRARRARSGASVGVDLQTVKRSLTKPRQR